MEFTQIKETCLYVSDLDQSYAFYHDKLGLPLISKVPNRHVFFRLGTSVLLCFIAEATKGEKELPPHFASGKQHIAFEVAKDNYNETKEKFKVLGIEITHCQKWPGSYESFYLEDPDGHVLEIVPEGMWS
ncbi:VOC family protein [Marinoscillum pacificum]|uniref:VOC family protein n=1 Tax=Marinoscillum pacificum TaxID=392723 RepID=UPI0021583D02|nr:VOC family protein [Marinoscillum pacificum]